MDDFIQYRLGMRDMLNRLTVDSPGHDAAEVECRALEQAIVDTEQSGDGDELRKRRNDAIYTLNRIADSAFGVTFVSLCGLGIDYSDWVNAPPRLASVLRPEVFEPLTADRTRDFV